MHVAPASAALLFDLAGSIASIEPFGTGHIHDTYAVTCETDAGPIRYVLQWINHLVFHDPEGVMENIVRVTEHLRAKLGDQTDTGSLSVVPARGGGPFVRDARGCYWRMYPLIENTRTCEAAEDVVEAREAARAFGRFMMLLSDLPEPRLRETIPWFHHTPKRLESLEDAVKGDPVGRMAGCREEIDFLLARSDLAPQLLDLHQAGYMPERVTHNDTKLNNVLLDSQTGRAVCVIDLDTVMPGLALYDFGDMVRTATSPAEEDERDLSKVVMRMPMFEALVEGYLEGAGDALTPGEKARLPLAGKVITYEQALRFLTDHLQGDKYFKVHRENHNLDRTRTQIRLIESMESQWEAMNETAARLG